MRVRGAKCGGGSVEGIAGIARYPSGGCPTSTAATNRGKAAGLRKTPTTSVCLLSPLLTRSNVRGPDPAPVLDRERDSPRARPLLRGGSVGERADEGGELPHPQRA
jgi:hypothetical protein